jgi:hypothetical protein
MLALPAAVVLAPSAPLLRVDQAVAEEAAVDRGATRHGGDLFAGEVVGDGARPPGGVEKAQLDDARLDLGPHLVGAGAGARRLTGQAGEAELRVAAQPAVHGLARDPVAEGDLGDGQPAHDLENCLVALLHDSQLDEHLPALLVDRPCGVSSRGQGVAPASDV